MEWNIVQLAARTNPCGLAKSFDTLRRSANPALLHRARFTTTTTRRKINERPYDTKGAPDSHYSQPAADVSQIVTQAEKDHFSQVEKESKRLQTRSPWTREGSDVPPVAQQRGSVATKGRLLTTPSRMLKLILPLATRDDNQKSKDIEPLALLVHPQQPLSYLERLIQSELPLLWDKDKDKERPPTISFRAEDSSDPNEESEEDASAEASNLGPEESYELENPEETVFGGKHERTGKISGGSARSGPVQNASAKAELPEDKSHPTFVRWSPSTEIGDFIRDAATGKEFAVDIEGAAEPILVGVPSFADRTYYLRMRLRKVSSRIATLADVKEDCDKIAHRGAKNLARAGFAGLLGWWGAVFYCTFYRTDLGWDVMEPVTYLVGLSGLIGGYLWFLYHNREASYRNAMHVTISRRQRALYEQKGFKMPQWETLIEEGNRLRREIKLVAEEYDVDWDETKDEGDEKVREALRKERKKKEGKHEEGDEESEKKEDEAK